LESVSATCAKLRELMENAVHSNIAECILLSGGLDTSIVAAIASRYTKLHGITVCLKDAPDERFAKLIADRFQLHHSIVRIDENDAIAATHDAVKIMLSFDPMEVRNDASILIGLRKAGALGFKEVLTGDAGDELFAGYSFLFNKDRDDLRRSLADMWKIMRFFSVPLAKSLGMHSNLSFMDPEFKEFAQKIPVELKVRQEQGRVYGKWILRKAFEHILPDETTWRVKMPIEQGSGTSILPAYFNNSILEAEFKAKREYYWQSDKVRIRDREHLFYYEAYRRMFGAPAGKGEGKKTCPGCSVRVPEGRNYCRTCGAYPVE